MAVNHHINIVGGSLSTRNARGFYNTVYVVDKNGELISKYDNAHLFGLMYEHLHLDTGESFGILNWRALLQQSIGTVQIPKMNLAVIL